eukprot:TRINITY_DN75196_c0_g1_i1.p1 TRINITY_DN75196_c0_g1~~TRINITY_DN75196_c0_g1_i1.p1  ORF type:complete len:471 (+),score=69.49 TRINITY_DN75196_c0_g1_i1:67-1479(+)
MFAIVIVCLRLWLLLSHLALVALGSSMPPRGGGDPSDWDRWERHQPNLPFCRGVADDVFKHTNIVPLQDGTFLPVYATPHKPEDVRQVVITQHGARRNGNTYFCRALRGVIKAGLSESTMVIAPVFRGMNLTASKWLNDTTATGMSATWQKEWVRWAIGDESDGLDGKRGVSSFSAMDSVVHWAMEKNPRLERVYVTAFSAGAQFALRWSIFSQEGANGKTTTGVPLRIILGDPAFYTYLTEERPVPSCVGNSTPTEDNWCEEFVRPPSSTCEGRWDAYGFGFGEIGSACSFEDSWECAARRYMVRAMRPMKRANAADDEDSGPSTTVISFQDIMEDVVDRFLSKDARFIFGTLDTQPVRNDLCEAALQGENRLERGLNYVASISYMTGGQTVIPYGFFNGAHDHRRFYKSPQFQEWIQPLSVERAAQQASSTISGANGNGATTTTQTEVSSTSPSTAGPASPNLRGSGR